MHDAEAIDGLFAAAMSSLSSGVNSSCLAISKDLIPQLRVAGAGAAVTISKQSIAVNLYRRRIARISDSAWVWFRNPRR